MLNDRIAPETQAQTPNWKEVGESTAAREERTTTFSFENIAHRALDWHDLS